MRTLYFWFNWIGWVIKTRSIHPRGMGYVPIFPRPLTEKEQEIGQRIWRELKEREPERAAEIEAYHDRCDRKEEEWRRLPWWRIA